MPKKSLLFVCLLSTLTLNACTAIPSSLIQSILSDLSPQTKAEIQGALQNFLSLSAEEQLEVAQVTQNPELVSYLRTQSTQSEPVRRRNLQNYCQNQPQVVEQIEKGRKELQTYYEANDAEVISAMEAWADLDDQDWQAQWEQVQTQREAWENKLEMMRRPGRFQPQFDDQTYAQRRAMADEFESCLYLPPQAQKKRVQYVKQRYGHQFNQYQRSNRPVYIPQTVVYQHTSITIIHSQPNCCRPVYVEHQQPNWDYPHDPRPYPNTWPSTRPTPRPWPIPTPISTPTPVPSASHSSDPDPGNKVTICHVPPGNPSAARTLRISASAWQQGHKPHHADDYLGACETSPQPSSTPTPQPSSSPTPEPTPTPDPTVTPTPEPTSSPESQITICHVPPGNLENPQTLTIGMSAWYHGHQTQHEDDYIGACIDSE